MQILLNIFQSVAFWFQHVGLMRPLLNLEPAKFLPIFFLAKNWKYFKQTKLALVRPGHKSTNKSVLKSLLELDQFLLELVDVVILTDLCSVFIELS